MTSPRNFNRKSTGVSRRWILAGMAAVPLASMTGLPGTARAQANWPARAPRVIVPYPPAGGADTTARILFSKASEQVGQQFVIENRGGAGGTIGEAVVAKAEPDGYTILHDATAFSVNGAPTAICNSTTTRISSRSSLPRWCRISWS